VGHLGWRKNPKVGCWSGPWLGGGIVRKHLDLRPRLRSPDLTVPLYHGGSRLAGTGHVHDHSLETFRRRDRWGSAGAASGQDKEKGKRQSPPGYLKLFPFAFFLFTWSFRLHRPLPRGTIRPYLKCFRRPRHCRFYHNSAPATATTWIQCIGPVDPRVDPGDENPVASAPQHCYDSSFLSQGIGRCGGSLDLLSSRRIGVSDGSEVGL